MKNSLTIQKPDDWHVHFRDHELLPLTVNASSKYFKRVLIMPNLSEPLTKVAAVLNYRERILNASHHTFNPLFTFYLNENLTKTELELAKEKHPFILGAKLYPQNVTTNSQSGIKEIKEIYPLLETMQTLDLVLQIHGEDINADIFEREKYFLTNYLSQLIKDFPKLRVVLEHISTKDAVQFVQNAPENVAATITPHHLMFNRNDLLAGGIRPHLYCLPILKTLEDQKALLDAATSLNPKFFAGTDSAPHSKENKECSVGCAGIFSAPDAVSLYAQAFDSLDKLDALNNFLSVFGANFYKQPETDEIIELIREPYKIPKEYIINTIKIIPAGADTTLDWRVAND